MKRPAEGRIHECVTAIGPRLFPAYVVRGVAKSLMIDSGMNHLSPTYLAAIRDLFSGDEERSGPPGRTHHPGRPDYLFLTHSHYDHIGSADYLRRHLPGLEIGAHERVIGLAQKPSALDTMNRLSMSHSELFHYNITGDDVTLRPFEIDIALKPGDQIDLGGLTCTVYATPGHTKDCLAFFFPEIGALFPGDAAGVLRTEAEGGVLHVEFVSSYQDYVASLRLMIDLKPEIICLAHNWVLAGADATEYLERSLEETFRYRRLLESHLAAAEGDADAALQAMVRTERGADGGAFQPSAGYLTNLAAQLKHIAGLQSREDT